MQAPDKSPLDMFRSDWQRAKSLKDANAVVCSLATVSADGQASIRTLVLREVTEESFVVFINATSPKYEDLQQSGQPKFGGAELMVFWPSLMQQYRVRGELSWVGDDAMAEHWAKKPYEAKILDHYYAECGPQSSVVDTRDALKAGVCSLKKRFPVDADIPYLNNAKGLVIKANYIESWCNSLEDRLHERYLYLLSDNSWEKQVLVP